MQVESQNSVFQTWQEATTHLQYDSNIDEPVNWKQGVKRWFNPPGFVCI